jgi:TetR/AcrR family transcriptional regulator
LKPLFDLGVLSEIDIRSLHFLVAHGGTAPFSLVPFAVADVVVAGLRARGA